MPHTFNIRMYYEDTDAGGIVYYANYLKFAERARSEAIRAVGVNQHDMIAHDGGLFIVSHVDITYHRPAMLDDCINIISELQKLSKVRMTVMQRMWRGDEKIVTMQVQLAHIDGKGAPKRMDDALFEKVGRAFN